MGETSDVVVALGIHEDLRLVLQSPERLGVQHSVSIPFEDGAIRVGLLVAASPGTLRSESCAGRKTLVLPLLGVVPGVTAERLFAHALGSIACAQAIEWQRQRQPPRRELFVEETRINRETGCSIW